MFNSIFTLISIYKSSVGSYESRTDNPETQAILGTKRRQTEQ